MPVVNGYTTLVAVKDALKITDAAEDSRLEACINAASRAIDRLTGRVYYATDATKYYQARDSETVDIDDLVSITSLATDDGTRTYPTTWQATDYDLEPANETPRTQIVVAPNGDYRFPSHRRGVRVVGSWGFASTAPDNIVEACTLLSMILWKRRDAILGTAGSPEIGEVVVIARKDPQLMLLLPGPRVRLV